VVWNHVFVLWDRMLIDDELYKLFGQFKVRAIASQAIGRPTNATIGW
jgi:hypothetical protein